MFTFLCWQSPAKVAEALERLENTHAESIVPQETSCFPAWGFCRTSNVSKHSPCSTQHGSWAASSWRASPIPMVRNVCYTRPVAQHALAFGFFLPCNTVRRNTYDRACFVSVPFLTLTTASEGLTSTCFHLHGVKTYIHGGQWSRLVGAQARHKPRQSDPGIQ